MAARQRDQTYGQATPRADAYTGMLVISLMATLAGLVFVFLDYNQYPPDLPKIKSMVATPAGGVPASPALAPNAGGGPVK